MKRTLLVILCALLAPRLFADSGQRLIPAGSLISCTTAEPKLSSRTTAIGDPVLCQVGHAERYGRSVLPYDSYLVGRFEDYKDPGHFVGKGWMELKFDRMVIEPDTVIPLNARVVDVPGYRVDNQGRILGKGHVARDIALWSIPILWPVDLLMLPMRGPRPTLKEETQLTLKVLDDLAVPTTNEPQQGPDGLMQRPTAYAPEPPPPTEDQQPAPETAYAPYDQPTAPEEYPAPPVMAYAPPMAVAPMPYPVPYAMPYAVAPPIMAYGQMAIGPRAPMMAYGYGARTYSSRPPMMAYGARPSYQRMPYGYGARAMGVRSFQARGGGGMMGRGGMGTRAGFRGR